MKLGVLIFRKAKDRATRDNSFDKLPYLGFRHVLNELNHGYEYVDIENISKYDYCLYSITSVYDVESLIIEIGKKGINKGKCKLVVGGAGCVNIVAIYDYIDIACFGRCEGQINGILAGQEYENVWRKVKDKDLSKLYIIRQAQELLPGEISVGCKNKCSFCQYTWTRKHIGNCNYNANWKLEEDDIKSTKILNSGRYITAIDGFSEQTRKRVNKSITDKDIYNFCGQIYDVDLKAAANVKVYSICGFPWETPETIRADLKSFGKILGEADRRSGTRRMVMMVMVTPFSPEPMTPMEGDKCNVNYNWGKEFEGMGRTIYKGIDIECFILPQINSPATLARRLIINRANLDNREKIQKILRTRYKTDNGLYTSQISKYLGYDIFNEMTRRPVEYLQSYCNYRHEKTK